MNTQQTISMKLLPEPRKLLAARTICINLYPSQFSWDLLELRKKTAIHFRSMKVLRIGSWRFRMWLSLSGWAPRNREVMMQLLMPGHSTENTESLDMGFWNKSVLKCVLPSWMLESQKTLNLRKLPAKHAVSPVPHSLVQGILATWPDRVGKKPVGYSRNYVFQVWLANSTPTSIVTSGSCGEHSASGYGEWSVRPIYIMLRSDYLVKGR